MPGRLGWSQSVQTWLVTGEERREREKKREGEGGGRGGLLIETPVGPWRRRDEPAGGKEGKEAESTATLVHLLPWR